MMPTKMKAWIVEDTKSYEGGCTVVWAEQRADNAEIAYRFFVGE